MPTLRLLTAVILCIMSASAVAAAVPAAPQVVGPIPVTDKSYPFGAADHTRRPRWTSSET